MSRAGAPPNLATPLEAAAELTKLSNSELSRLRAIARLRCLGLQSVDWEDLVNETFARILNGSRRWPKGVPFMAFLAQTIRSIANEEWRDASRSVSLEVMPISDESSLHVQANPEREVIARQTLEQIESYFKGDDHALAVLNGFAEGMTPQEIQTEAKLTPTTYASTQRRIRRTLKRKLEAADE